MLIEGSVAVVTGAASGLGAATAEALAAAGAHVVGVDLHPPRAATATVRYVSADVTDDAQLAAAFDVADRLGPVRIVVACAGIAPSARVVRRDGLHALDTFDRVLRINVLGTFAAVRHGAARMRELEPIDGERGVIVTTASIAAFDGQIGQAAYSASKGAVAAMTLPIARELSASSVRVATIAPGVFETPMVAGFSDQVQESLAAQVPHPARLGRATEYASLVRHIVENAYLNGETIRLDGAIRMGPR